jgi:hypothetical protein
MKRAALLIASAVLACGLPALAAPIVTVGAYTIPVGQSSEPILIDISDSAPAAAEDIEGMVFTLQVASGTGTSPSITSVDLQTDTIWSPVSTSPLDVTIPSGGSQPQFASRDILTDNFGEFANANGLLATVDLNTAGVAPGTYALLLTGTIDPGANSQFFNGLGQPVSATFNAGSLTVTSAVPEPASAALLILGGMALAARRRSRVAGNS